MTRLAQARNTFLAAAAFSMMALAAQAGPNLVVDGDFTGTNCGTTTCQLTNGSDGSTGLAQIGTGTNATGWVNSSGNSTTSGYSWVVYSNGAGNSSISGGTVALPFGNGSGGISIGMTSLSPNGNNFLVQDGNYINGTLSQTIAGLTPGANYSVSFYEAAAQQTNYTGGTTSTWTVGFGSSTYTPTPLSISQGGFSGWVQVAVTFTATAASQVLSFTAVGTGGPPFAALDGVSVTAVPEPASFAILGAGVVGLAALRRRRGGTSL